MLHLLLYYSYELFSKPIQAFLQSLQKYGNFFQRIVSSKAQPDRAVRTLVIHSHRGEHMTCSSLGTG